MSETDLKKIFYKLSGFEYKIEEFWFTKMFLYKPQSDTWLKTE